MNSPLKQPELIALTVKYNYTSLAKYNARNEII